MVLAAPAAARACRTSVAGRASTLSLIAGLITAGVIGPLLGGAPSSSTVSTTTDSDIVGTTALGCDVRTSLTDTAGRPSADAVCTRNALIERACSMSVDDLPYAGYSNGITVWADASAGEMVKFSKNFTPTSPFTGAGVECVNHTTVNGELIANVHELSLRADDWVAMNHSGTLPADLEQRIADA